MDDDDEIVELFKSASNFIKATAGKYSSADLLYLYSRFKQANDGPCRIPKPGFFDFEGKQKWEAWNKLADKSKKDAMLEYVNKVIELDGEWEEKMDSGKVQQKSGMGVAVSTLHHPEEPVLSDDCKTIFDWCKEGNTDAVQQRLVHNTIDTNQLDDNGLALLHWACDRGHEAVVHVLLDSGADINVRDAEGQTPLHYASSCEHLRIVKMLVSRGADRTLTDTDGSSPLDMTSNADIAAILTSG
jgi:acyl-CoA-binding protein